MLGKLLLKQHHPFILDILAVPYRFRYAALPHIVIRESTAMKPGNVAQVARWSGLSEKEYFYRQVRADIDWALTEFRDCTRWRPT